ncbi:MAG: bacteriophage abortive infection AbiH family protein [Ruminococcus sp.]|nr:bacteriophage abortive infection AbiH family protein [Ruminococcus sp.]
MPPRKILIIGNGFDVANGLPTKYCEFLEFCEKASYIFEEASLVNSKEYYDEYLKEWMFDSNVKTFLRNIFILKRSSNEDILKLDLNLNIIDKYNSLNDNSHYLQILEELYKCIQGNVWYKYFQEKIKGNSKLGKNWIDFESEIAKVLLSKDKNQSLYSNMKYKLRVHDDEMPSILLEHLNRLTHALEIYLNIVLRTIKPKMIKDLNNLKFDYVLSFNYTDTFFRCYINNFFNYTSEYCYIHGKASDNSSVETCNLVLGIDDKEEIDDEQFLAFKKFYQRIIKQTDNKYSNWLDEIKISPELKSELHIFGHSLDVTDKDILKDFIVNDNVYTTIYYYRRYENDKADFSSKIRNLIKIIGKEELIKRTSNGTIKFVPQKLAEKTE